MKLVNCGCGNKYVSTEEWINIDFNGITDKVISHNILAGLPFQNNSIDAIFSSCMLEHFERSEAYFFIKECYRCLKSGGVIRLVVPDLEDVCKEYLSILEHVKKNDDYRKKYEYIVIELLDQMTRKQSGGEMAKYWARGDKDNQYILQRTGYPEKRIKGKVTVRHLFKIRREKIIDRLLGGGEDLKYTKHIN